MSKHRKSSKRKDTDKAIANLIKWSSRPQWAEAMVEQHEVHLGRICEAVDMDMDSLIEELRAMDLYPHVFGTMLEDLASIEVGDEGLNLVDDYLKRRRWHESPAGARYLQKIRASVMSLYEIVELVPGRSCQIRDLLRGGAAVTVHEKLGTQQMVKWDVIAARVLPGDNSEKTIFTGALFPIERELLDELLETIRSQSDGLLPHVGNQSDLFATPAKIDEELRAFCPLVTQFWVATNMGSMHQPPPDLTNSAGETFVVAETVFRINGVDADTIAARIDGHPDLLRGDELDDESGRPFWNWLDNTPKQKKAKPKASDSNEGIMLQSFINGNQSVKGSLELFEDRLCFTTNSRERADAGIALLQNLLGDAVRPPLTSFQSVEQLMAKKQKESGENVQVDDGLSSEFKAEMMQHYLDDYYRDLLTEPIPALDNKSPRQAAKSKKGRAQLIEWLKMLDNNEHRRARQQGTTAYDTRWLWHELGLTAEREEV